MEGEIYKSRFIHKYIGRICFMAFGVSAFSYSIHTLNSISVIYGILLGLFFGWLFKRFLMMFLGIFNYKLKKEKNKGMLQYVVDTGILFITPFAVMILLSVFYLHWSVTGGFISAGLMAAGAAASIEIGKIIGKQQIKNTIATSLVSFLFSLIWAFSYTYMVKAPSLIQGGLKIVINLVSKGGSGL